MQRLPVAIIVLLAALLLGRDPHVQKADRLFLDWLLRNTDPSVRQRPSLTLVDIERASLPAQKSTSSEAAAAGPGMSISPLDFALFLQSIFDFKPTALAIEPVLRWREHDRDQEQVFLDQAMRIPKLLLGAELTSTPDPDTPASEIVGFTHVRGRRGDLPTFTGIAQQPDEDLRLISTLAFVNLPEDVAGETHVPLLFQYRGEVIPAFALQAFLTWARIPIGNVSVQIGSHITLPGGGEIPIDSEGMLTVNPNAARLARHFTLNELLLLAQEHGKDSPLESLHEDLVLARTPTVSKPDDPDEIHRMRAAGVFAAAIATLQSNHFVRRVSLVFDCAVLLLIALLAWPAMSARRIDVILGAIAFTAAYCLLAFGLMARYSLYIPGLVPLSAAWLLAFIALITPRQRHVADPADIVASPPAP